MSGKVQQRYNALVVSKTGENIQMSDVLYQAPADEHMELELCEDQEK